MSKNIMWNALVCFSSGRPRYWIVCGVHKDGKENLVAMKQLQSDKHSLHVERRDEALVISPIGACDDRCAQALEGLMSHVDSDADNIILDTSKVKYIESPGFRWIVDRFRAMQTLGGAFVVTGLKGSTERAFKLLQLDKFIPSASNVEAAISWLKRGRGQNDS